MACNIDNVINMILNEMFDRIFNEALLNVLNSLNDTVCDVLRRSTFTYSLNLFFSLCCFVRALVFFIMKRHVEQNALTLLDILENVLNDILKNILKDVIQEFLIDSMSGILANVIAWLIRDFIVNLNSHLNVILS